MVPRLLGEGSVDTSSTTLEHLMTPRPIGVAPEESLDIAQALMVACRLRHLPVQAGGRLVGLLTLGDLLSASLPADEATPGEQRRHLRQTSVAAAMRAPVVSATRDTDLWVAAQRFVDQHITCLPIVDAGDRVCGMVTRSDFLVRATALLRAEEQETGRAVPIARLMTPRPLAACAPADRLDVAHALMKAEKVRHLPVLTDGKLVGILSDHDVVAAVGYRGPDAGPVAPLERKAALWVSDAMSRRVVTISPDDSAVQAGELLRRRRFGALPVVKHGCLLGMLTVSDYFYDLLARAPEPSLQGRPVAKVV